MYMEFTIAMRHHKILLIIILILCSTGIPFTTAGQELPQDPETLSQNEERATVAEVYPKVGVVLSGGGARGFAHIGALKVLEEIGLPIDYIVGTSMGSIVGGLYAIGYSAEEIEEIVNEVDWEELFTDTPPRKLWSYQKKRISAKYMFEVGFNWDGFVIPRGLTAGQKISNLMAFLTIQASDIGHFDDFPIPYRAVGTDIVTGEEVILDHGSLPDAMRASMAVPGVFTPIEIDGRLLVDGGVVKNLPVDVAKNMGADLVIAIDISTPLRNKDALRNPVSILNQVIGLQITKVTEEQRKLADIVIIPELEGYSSSSFGKASEIIPLGEKATRTKLHELQDLLQKIRKTRPQSREVPQMVVQNIEEIYIEDIVVEGNITGNEQILLSQLREQKGQPLNPDFLEQKITEIFSTGKYETVKFALSPGSQKGKILKLQLQEREQGSHLLRFGMNYESRFDDAEEDKMVFLANATLNNLTGSGAYWSTDLQFVNVTKIVSEYFQPLGKGFFIAPFAYDSSDFQTVYEDKESIARYDKDELGVGVRLGTFIRRVGEVSVGYLLEYADVTSAIALGEEFPDFYETITSFIARSRLDLLDTFPFPTSGSTLNIDYQMASKDLGGEIDFHKLAIEYWRYFTLGKRSTFGLGLHTGTSFDSELQPYNSFFLGGRDSFVGYKVEERLGSHLGVTTLEYRYRFYQLPSAVGGGIFAIATGNIGNAWKTVEEMTDDFSLRYGGSLGIGVDTILGPVRADFAIGDGGRQVIYLNIGYKF
jgi:NTE family protein